ncbi:MAG: AAA family ATPase [Verrucomicrobiota bacterium]|nr:AAA family ATPase [Verrucomicrobiota bacterium]
MYYYRLLQNRLSSEISKNKIRLIFGARQTGKTYLLNHLLSSKKTVIYNLQDSALRHRLEMEPGRFTRELKALPHYIVNIFVDEIQKIPSLLDEVQFLYDKDKSRFQFYLTGSSARKLRTHSANLLPGRSHLYHLYPVISLEENNSISRLSGIDTFQKETLFPVRSLEKRLIYGNLPGIREEKTETAVATLEAYVINYIEEEIRSEMLIKDLGAFHVFLQLAASESINQINLSKLSQESGIPVSTVKNYYQVLADTFVGYWLQPYRKLSRKRLLTTPEFLFFDTGVCNAAARFNIQSSLLNEIGGRLFENAVGIELIHRAATLGQHFSVSFWRTVSGTEVDFIWETPNEDIPIEVKWTQSPSSKHAKNVEKFIDIHHERCSRGFVVCRIKQAQQLSERVTAIPFFEL